MRVLELATGFSSASAPTGGAASTGKLGVYADDAAYEAANGAATNGSAYINSSTGLVRFYLASAWHNMLTDDGVAQLTNKDYDGGTASNARRMTLPKSTFATLSGLTRKVATLFWATDRNKVFVDDGASIRGIGGGGGGSSLAWRLAEDAESPEEVIENNMRVLKYMDGITQTAYANLKVPDSYNAGDQLKLRIAAYSPSSSNGFLLRAVATLIRKNTDAVTSTTNQRTTTNTAVTNTVANQYREIELDISSSSGQINAVSIAAGDTIRLSLARIFGDAGDTDTADVRFIPELTEVLLS